MNICKDNEINKNAERFNIFMISGCIGLGILGYLLMSWLYSMVLSTVYSAIDYEMYLALVDSSIFQNAMYIVYALFCVVLPFLLVHLVMKLFSAERIPFSRPRGGVVPSMFIGLGVCVLGNYASVFFTVITESIFGTTPTGAPSDVTSASQISLVGFLVSVLSTAVMPALAEEFALRGVVMQPLRKYGDKFAVVFSALIFSLIHGNFEQIPFAFVVGLALGYVVIRTNSIWAGVLLHFLNNFWAVCSEYLYYLVSPTLYGVLYYATNAVVCIAAIVSAIYLYKKDVKNGITEGVLKKPECSIPVFQKSLLAVYSPTFLIGVWFLIDSALKNFIKV